MTAIIAKRCRDGVVLGSDRLTMVGDWQIYTKKFHWHQGYVVAWAGTLVEPSVYDILNPFPREPKELIRRLADYNRAHQQQFEVLLIDPDLRFWGESIGRLPISNNDNVIAIGVDTSFPFLGPDCSFAEALGFVAAYLVRVRAANPGLVGWEPHTGPDIALIMKGGQELKVTVPNIDTIGLG